METTRDKPVRLRKNAIIAAGIFFIDGLLFNQGAIAAITLFVVIAVFLPAALYKRYKGVSIKPRLAKCAIYAVASLMVFGANHLNNKIAKARADDLIAKIEQYRQENGEFPATLEALVPKYIVVVPAAKLTLIANRFSYRNQDGRASLYYVAMPPFGRLVYGFNSRQWSYLD